MLHNVTWSENKADSSWRGSSRIQSVSQVQYSSTYMVAFSNPTTYKSAIFVPFSKCDTNLTMAPITSYILSRSYFRQIDFLDFPNK